MFEQIATPRVEIHALRAPRATFSDPPHTASEKRSLVGLNKYELRVRAVCVRYLREKGRSLVNDAGNSRASERKIILLVGRDSVEP